MPASLLPPIVRGPRLRIGLALATGALALVVLAGCTSEAAPTSTPSSPPNGEATEVPTESSTPTPTPEAAGTPVTISCDQILTADDVYLFNPNVGTAPNYEPAAGSAAETAVSYDGVACGWLNQTSNEIIEISIVQPNDILMSDLKNKAVIESNAVPTYGTPPAVEGYFTNSSGPGQAQVFAGKYWVVANSVAFFEPGDAQQIIATVVSHLP